MYRTTSAVAGCLIFLGSLAVAASPALAAGEYEPNDSLVTSAGPLPGETPIDASFETENDSDFYRFYVIRRAQLDISGTALSETTCGSAPPSKLELLDGDGRELAYVVGLGYNYIDHLYVTLGVGKYHLVGDPGICAPPYPYRFQIDSGGALAPNDTCGEAHVDRVQAEGEIEALEKKLDRLKQSGSDRARKRRRMARRELREVRRDHASASSAAAEACY